MSPPLSDEWGARQLARPILDAANHQADIPIRDSRRAITLAEFIPEWRRLAASSFKPSTLKGIESNIRAHIIPVLGDKPLTTLDARQYQELIVSMMEGRAKGTREKPTARALERAEKVRAVAALVR